MKIFILLALRRLRLKYSGVVDGSSTATSTSPRYSETADSMSPAGSVTPIGSPTEDAAFDFEAGGGVSSPPLLRVGGRSAPSARYRF